MLRTLRRSSALLVVSTLLPLLAGCAAPSASTRNAPEAGSGAQTLARGADPLNPIAESYVKLVLAVGQHDADYVDAYYGPPEWRAQAEAAGKRPLTEIRAEAQSLIERLGGLRPAASAEELVRLRHTYLTRQLSSLVTRVDMLSGKKLSFDEEARALYDADVPRHGADHFQAMLDKLSSALPGQGPITERYDAFRKQFEIPRDRVDAVFQAAIAECRRRTAEHIDFPAGESFTVEYVTGKSWAGYNWYQGNYKSLIQVNMDLPIYIERAIDLACHEGYPGHHLYNALLEKNLVRDRGWIEASVYPLFSPQSFIAEGTANYGIEVAFTEPERIEFERRVLMPIAGLDGGQLDKYYEIQRLMRGTGQAANEAARQYLNGQMTREQAMQWLARYALQNEKRADTQIRFIDQYRTYLINYNVGRDLVREYIERGNVGREERWERFEGLLSSPRLPSSLK